MVSASNCCIAAIQPDVVLGCAAGVEANCAANDEGDSFRLGLADAFRSALPALAMVHKLVRDLMRKSCKLLSRRLAGQQRDPAACGFATGRCNILRVFKGDALLRHKLRKALTVLPGIAVDASDCRQFLPVRLADIKDIRGTESNRRRRIIRLGLFSDSRLCA